MKPLKHSTRGILYAIAGFALFWTGIAPLLGEIQDFYRPLHALGVHGTLWALVSALTVFTAWIMLTAHCILRFIMFAMRASREQERALEALDTIGARER